MLFSNTLIVRIFSSVSLILSVSHFSDKKSWLELSKVRRFTTLDLISILSIILVQHSMNYVVTKVSIPVDSVSDPNIFLLTEIGLI